MRGNEIKILEKAIIVGVAVVISIVICSFFNLSEFYAGIAALNVINLNDAKTRRQAYERTITTFCGGVIACLIAYLGFKQNMLIYILGLGLVCLVTEMVLKVPATVGCIAFTYIMLNIDPNKDPQGYVEERVIGTFVGAIIVSIIVTIYNRIRNKPKEKLEKTTVQPASHHIKRGVIPGIAVILGFFIISYLNKYLDSRYVTNYTLYYCALASIVPFHMDMKELLFKSKERVISTILGGVGAFLFIFFNLHGILWIGIGITLIIAIIEIFIKVSASLAGIVFLFIMINMKYEVAPWVYYIDRVVGTVIGIILIIGTSYSIGKFREYIVKLGK